MRSGVYKIFSYVLIASSFTFGLLEGSTGQEFENVLDGSINSLVDVARVFPGSPDEIVAQAERAIARADRDLEVFLSLKDGDRTFDNTVRYLDEIQRKFSSAVCGVDILEMVHPEQAMRDASHAQSEVLTNYSVDAFSNKSIYQAFKAYYEGNYPSERAGLTSEENYVMEKSMKDFRRAGFDLPDEQFARVKDLEKQLAKKSMKFSNNIAEDRSSITVQEADLVGVDTDFIAAQARDEQGNIILYPNYPTMAAVRGYCEDPRIREQISQLFSNRAYPENLGLLEEIIADRDKLAGMLGFESFGHLAISKEMAETPERAEAFIREVAERGLKKAHLEIAELKKNLPAGVNLTESGKIRSSDYVYIENSYSKKHYNFDEREVANYFPVERTVAGIFSIYQDFFSLTFKEEQPEGLWDDSVRAIGVYSKDGAHRLGYVLLDLYPREGKYSHACCCPIIPALSSGNTAVTMVIANFPKASGDKPALLTHRDVTTFFHEFGHAMHYILGRTKLAECSGFHVKWDFVEMPSQILEEWMYDRDLLREVSGHYQTGESLPEHLINALIDLRKITAGYDAVRQCYFALFSLACYKPGAQKDVMKLFREIGAELLPFIESDPQNHTPASFGHLMGYGPRYYGYMWSKVYALDMFDLIQKHGLRDPEIGGRFKKYILGPGGSDDPNNLLRNFLGRDPNQEAFYRIMGL